MTRTTSAARSFFWMLALVATMLLAWSAPAPLFAQETTEAATEAAPAEDAAPADASEEAEPEKPSFPEELANPDIDIQELKLRVIPLTVDELTGLADAWLATVKDTAEAVADKQVEVLNAAEDDADPLRAQVAELSTTRGLAFERFSAVVDNLEKKGGDEAAIAGYRAYRNAIVIEEKQQADFKTLLKQSLSWAVDPDGGVKLATRVAVIVASIVGLLIVAGIVRRFARKAFARIPNLSMLLTSFLSLVVYWVTVAIGLMVVLSALGVDITPIFALVGGASFIIAFALQDTLGNLASGMMIMINRPFDEGDYVNIAGTGGTVQSVSVVSTTVTTPDNQVIVIPNSKVWGDVITNVTASETRRVDLVFGVGYDDDLETAHDVMARVVQSHPKILSDPEPVIRVNELADSSVNFIVRPWVKIEDYWTVYWDLMRTMKEELDAAGLSIPYPQTDMHIHMSSSTPPLVASPHSVHPVEHHEPSQGIAEGDEGHEAESNSGNDRGE